MLRRNRREAAVNDFARLVAQLPAGCTVIATLPRRNRHALAINALVDDAAAAGRVRVADMRGRTLASLRGTRAEDHFHPNERGCASIADAFAAAIGLEPSPR
jgi:lysophospholipase L1-like esterase